MTADVRFEATPSFLQILEVTGCTIALSAYLQGRLVLISAHGGAIHIEPTALERPMGIATWVQDDVAHMAVATLNETVVFRDEPLLAPGMPGRRGAFDHLLIPRATYYSGDLDMHDMAWLGNERGLVGANTRFCCLCAVGPRHSFEPIWQPPFISALMPEDRCHVNGLAAAQDQIRYVTALGAGDTRRSWSKDRAAGGVLIDASSGEFVLQRLSMPHSPRLFGDALYVLESGEGRVLKVDAAAGSAETMATLPGFTRGMDRYGDILFVGLSRIRDAASVHLPIRSRHDDLICGIAALELRTGRLLGWLKFVDIYQEIFDVKVMPHMRRTAAVSPYDELHRFAITLPGRAFWNAPREDQVQPAVPPQVP